MGRCLTSSSRRQVSCSRDLAVAFFFLWVRGQASPASTQVENMPEKVWSLSLHDSKSLWGMSYLYGDVKWEWLWDLR